MTLRVLTMTNMVRGTETTDLVATAGTAMSDGDTFEVDCKFNDDVIFVVKGSGTATLTFDAGVSPPSLKAIKGADTVAIANAEVKNYIPEAGRHVQASGKITGSLVGAAGRLMAFRGAPGFIGVTN